MVFSSEVEWEQEERLYVHSVVSHMYEKPAVDNGRSLVSTERDKKHLNNPASFCLCVLCFSWLLNEL